MPRSPMRARLAASPDSKPAFRFRFSPTAPWVYNLPMKLLYSFVLCTLTLFALGTTPKVAPIGNPKAPKGGTIIIGLASYPKSLLYYLATDEMSLAINALILEPLLESHPDTNEL